MKNMKINIKIVIIAIATLIVIGIGAAIILKNIGKGKPKKEAINLFEDEMFTNDTVEILDSTTVLDDIFGTELSEEDKALLALTNIVPTNVPKVSEISSNNTQQKNTNESKSYSKIQPASDLYAIVEEKTNVANKSQIDNREIDYYNDEGDSNLPLAGYGNSYNPKKVNIKSFIIDYNKTFTASINKPVFITLVIKTPSNAKYSKIRVYARRLANNNEILSRDLIFSLPRIRVVDGQAQTQFYFAGRNISKKQLRKGRYLLYAEAEVTDKNGKSVGKTGRYPLPKWDYILTIK